MQSDENWRRLTEQEIRALKPGDEVVVKYTNPNDPGSERQFVHGVVAETEGENGKPRFINPISRETLPEWGEIGKSA